MVRASVLIGDEPFAKPEDADFEFADRNDAVVAIGQFAAAPTMISVIMRSPLKAGSPGAGTTWRCRTD